jgi:hypothetical protein
VAALADAELCLAKCTMGNEVNCTVTQSGKPSTGRALLETSEIIFRGEGARFKIPFSSISEVGVEDGELHVRTKDGLITFRLGSKAEKWQEKIANPKSLIAKLGVKPGERVTLIGRIPSEFCASLKKHGANLATPKASVAPRWIFFAAESREDLADVKRIARSVRGTTALWIIYPKGQKQITEADVRSSGIASGLTDIKVTSFSPAHTALKFVLPKAKR